MRAVKKENIMVLEVDEIIPDEIEYYFLTNRNSTVYVTKRDQLYGIITFNDFYRNKENGNYVNTNFKMLCDNGKETEQVERDAIRLFLEFGSIREIPVVNEHRNLLYSYVRVGNVSDVLPERFTSLYGTNGKLSEYISKNNPEGIEIVSDYPEIVQRYLEKFPPEVNVNVKTEGKGVFFESICDEFEWYMFGVRSKKFSAHFVTLPEYEKMNTFTEEEKERVYVLEKTPSYYLKKVFSDKDIYELAKRVLGSDAHEAFVEGCLESTARFIIKNGLCYNADLKNNYVKVINGKRITTDGPSNPHGEVYVYGPCTVFGVIVDDEHTIPSCMQRIFNQENVNRIVVNEGMIGAPMLEEVRKFNRMRFKDNSAFVFVLRQSEAEEVKKVRPEVTIYSLTEYFDSFEFKDYFFDRPYHCNKVANQKVAEYIFSLLDKKEINKKYKEVDEPIIALSSMEYKKEILDYTNMLRAFYKEGRNGAIVMNCNPFTKGHLYLIEYAAKQVDNLYIFIVSEDKSYFSFDDRLRLVKEGVSHLDNVEVLPSGRFILSSDTFPEYFTKECVDQNVYIDTTFDLEIFANHVAPALDIITRFVGEEPTDVVTRQYNRDMSNVLPDYGIQVVCIPRMHTKQGKCVSASTVRRLIKEEMWEEIKEMVPQCTYQYLLNRRETI